MATMNALREISRPAIRRAEAPIVARLNGVTKNYGGVRALQSVDFTVRAGELVALLGPNGAGKTTAIKLLLGLAKPSAGQVTVFGGNPVDPEVRLRIGAMLQVAKIPETLRVSEHIDLFSSYYPNPLPLARDSGDQWTCRPQTSRFRRTLGRPETACALCPGAVRRSRHLVPRRTHRGLDVEARRLLWEEIRKLVPRGKTILLTTHYLEEADALADRVAVINRGKIIAEGTPSEIKARTRWTPHPLRQ